MAMRRRTGPLIDLIRLRLHLLLLQLLGLFLSWSTAFCLLGRLRVEQLAALWEAEANNQIVVVFVGAVSVLHPHWILLPRWILLSHWILLPLPARTYVCLGGIFEKRDDPRARVVFLVEYHIGLLSLLSARQTL